ncbi:MAG: TIGR02285 family protein [Methylococcales bacterium]|nr:TIGR02285 family protein [Methylococcales bacterium]
MAKFYINFFVTLLVCLGSYPVTAEHDLRWRIIDWPPMYISSGVHINQGVYDQMIELLNMGMPSYQHQTQTMNTKRVLFEMGKGEKICHPSALKDAGATSLLSVMNSIILPHQIIIHKDSLNQLGNVTEYALKTLLNNKLLRGGLVPGRYSKSINQIIDAQLKSKNNHHLVIIESYHNLTKMLLDKRIDYIVEYEVAVSFQAKTLNKENLTVSLDIIDSGNPGFLPVYVACPKTEWGKLVINEVNKILITESQNNLSLQSRIQWFNEENRKKLKYFYKQHYFTDKHTQTH